jgi:choice-of-anchor A domain-containing protein
VKLVRLVTPILAMFAFSTVSSAQTSEDLSSFNVIALENLELFDSQTEGRILSFKDASISHYSIGGVMTPDTRRCDLIAAENLRFTDGSIYSGAICYGLTASVFNVGTLTYSRRQLPDLSVIRASINSLNSQLSDAFATENFEQVTEVANGTIQLSSTRAGQNLFQIQSSSLNGVSQIDINGSQDALTVIKITGQEVDLSSVGFKLTNATAENILWFLPEARSINLSRLNFQGSILAPEAHFELFEGRHNGTVIARSIAGNGFFQYRPMSKKF